MRTLSFGKLRFINSWTVLAGATIGLALSHAPVLMYTFIVFLKPLAMEFGWQRGATASIFSLTHIGIGIVLPFVGAAIDRFGARRILIPSFAGLGVVVMSMSMLPGSIWVWYAVFVLLVPPLAAGSGLTPMARVVTAWFDQRRGFALGVAVAGIGLGSMIFPPLAQALTEAYSWRFAYLILGSIVLGIGLPAMVLLIHDEASTQPGAASRPLVEASNGAGQTEKTGLTSRQAKEESSFWIIGSAIFLIGAAISGTMLHLSAMLTDGGMDAATAAKLVSALGAASMIARIVVGLLYDRFFAPQVAAIVISLAIIANLLLAFGVSSTWPALLTAIFLGIAFGAEIDMLGYLTSRYFGSRNFGTICAIFLAVLQFGMAIGPVAFGYAYDRIGNYTAALQISAVVIAIAALLLLRLGPYPQFGQVGQADT